MSAPHVIRRAKAEDAPALAELGRVTFIESFGECYAREDLEHYLSQAYDTGTHRLWCADPAHYILVSESEGVLTGFAIGSACTLPLDTGAERAYQLRRLYLRRSAHGAGLGTQLIRQVMKHAGEQAWETIYLSVWEHNHSAQRFYAKHGFTQVGEFDFPIGRQIDRELIFRKAL